MNKLSFNVNNGHTLSLTQRQHDGSTLIQVENEAGHTEYIADSEAFISPGDMVMLINYYRYIKRYNIQHDYINPTGKAVEQ
jgi:hypothetical protein